jgi:hypothetical protein
MANPVPVAVNKCDVKDIFDNKLKAAALKLVKSTIKTLVDGAKGLTYDEGNKQGWLLSVTVTSVDVDDANKPTTLEAKVLIGAVHSAFKGFNASGSAKASGGINAKKMDQEVASIVQDAVKDTMTKRAIPQMLKP